MGQVYVVLQAASVKGAGLSFSVRGADQLKLIGTGLDWRYCRHLL